MLFLFDDGYTKTKIRAYGDNIYTNFCGLNTPQDGVEYESFTIISIDSLHAYEHKYYLEVYLDNVIWWQSFWVWLKLFFWFWRTGLINAVWW